MLTMKKDMGGAATVLAIAHMVMDAKLDVRLRVLIPAVENSVSGSAYRPGDVLKSRKGLTVEIGNTDAEGRLVLADALALADDEKPDLADRHRHARPGPRAAPPAWNCRPSSPMTKRSPPISCATARRSTIRCGGCRLWRGYEATLDKPDRRSQQCARLQSCRRDHGGACSSTAS